MESVIYRDLEKSVAERCGYFTPKEKLHLLDQDVFYSDRSVTENTRVIYFPGSFGTFHEGHVAVAKAAMAKHRRSLLVIAPANSDYNVEKYGAWSVRASNKHRYEAIKQALPKAVIDIDPMLNHRCDQNFTDLLEQFLLGHGLTIESMKNPPIILTGKDRADWLHLNDVHSHVKVEYFDDTTGASTSALVDQQRPKKHCKLRCHNARELALFKAYFEDQYLSIEPIYLEEEIERARRAVEAIEISHTICKDYAHLVPYIKLSRNFANPLEDGTHHEDDPRFTPGMVILDSDIYSGSTRDFIERQGCEFYALYNYSGATDKVELLDIDDFRKPDFCYPYVDISSRCSMQAFDFDFHYHFKAFKAELNHVVL